MGAMGRDTNRDRVRKRRSRLWRRTGMTVGACLVLVGLAAGILGVVNPSALEQLFGWGKSHAQKAITAVDEGLHSAERKKIEEDIDAGRDVGADEMKKVYPTVTLGWNGTIRQLNYCDGTFTIMASYAHEGVPVTAAAHNNCGGDVVLNWDTGQRVYIQGQGLDGLYQVVEARAVNKTWGNTDDLVGLRGDLALQTCFYGVNQMRFVGLERVTGS